jgi:hypothetical protein
MPLNKIEVLQLAPCLQYSVLAPHKSRELRLEIDYRFNYGWDGRI